MSYTKHAIVAAIGIGLGIGFYFTFRGGKGDQPPPSITTVPVGSSASECGSDNVVFTDHSDADEF